jgi:hypothetical protein
MIKKSLVAALVGIVLGITGSRYLFVGSALSLIPWGIAGLLFGLWCPNYREAIAIGALYGFVLAFSFMVSGYQGSAPVLTRLPFFAILGLVGAVCGVGLGVIGCFIFRKIKNDVK